MKKFNWKLKTAIYIGDFSHFIKATWKSLKKQLKEIIKLRF